MADRLDLALLGQIRITLDDAPLSFLYTKAQALLCYLAVTARPQSRDALATLFWGEMPDREAKNSLRNALSNLRHLAGSHLVITRETAAFDVSSPYALDVQQFRDQLASVHRGIALSESQIESVRCGLDLYRGDFLDALYVRDAPTFEEWVLAERESLRLLAVQGLHALIAYYASRGDSQAGIDSCRRLLAIEPLQEQTHRQLMLLLALHGERDAALAQYETCRKLMRQDLGIDPMPETTALYERIASSHLGTIADTPTPLRSSPPTPMVGRAMEFAQIQEVWRQAAAGRPQFVVISGEAGIGKTRLAEEMVGWAAAQDVATASARVHEFDSNLLYAPVPYWLRSDPIRTALPLLDDVWLGEIARLVPEVLANRPNLPSPAPISDPIHRTRFFEALARAILFSKKPLLLWLDDLQWCDGETLDWLQYLLRYDAQARLLLVTTLRIEEAVGNRPIAEMLFSLRRTGQLTEIELGPLDETATARLAQHWSNFSAAQMSRLFQETEGNPLFLTEMVQAGLVDEPQPNALASTRLPPTMLAVIQRRLAQLSAPARELAGIAATLDHEFDLSLLARISGQAEGTVLPTLEELTRRRILRELGEAVYDLSHPKLRKVAYQEQSSARRKELHRRAAQALEAIHANALDAASAQIAAHWERAGMVEPAIPYYERAGRAARRVYANSQAIQYLRQALKLLGDCPSNPARDRQELTLQMALGMALGANRGWASGDAEQAFARARQLSAQVGQTPDLVPVLAGLSLGYLNAGKVAATLELGNQLLELARRTNSMGGVLGAHFALGTMFLFKGDFAAAKDQGDQGIAVYDPLAHGPLALQIGQDSGVNCRNFKALAQWFLGYPDLALQTAQTALALARQLSNPQALAGALLYTGWLHQLRRDVKGTREHIDPLIALATEKGFPIWLGLGMWLKGWAMAAQGEWTEGIAWVRRGLELHDEIGESLARPVGLVLFAETYRMDRQLEEAESQLVNALASGEQTGQRIIESEAHRLRGEILLQTSSGRNDDQAEACFLRAISVAQAQKAKSLELRSVVSLCRLWQRQGRQTDADARLAETVRWFPEGIAIPNLLQERKSLVFA